MQVRRAWSRQQVMAEFESATRTAARMLAFVRHTPMRAVPMRLNELGSFPMALLVGGALVFDLHTHLRHDMTPALGLPTPAFATTTSTDPPGSVRIATTGPRTALRM